MKLGVLFGSSSNEHDISILSAKTIIDNIDKSKYEVTPIYLDKENNFYICKGDIPNTLGEIPSKLELVTDYLKFLKQFNLIFLMVHGKNGEDGILSSILEFSHILYVANKPMASIATMDKVLTKIILENNGIKTSPYLYFTKYNNEYIYKGESISWGMLLETIEKKLKYPIYVKPANSGSSIGINKVNSRDELEEALNIALKIDSKILIESEIKGRELECGILETNGNLIASSVGEVLKDTDFYSYERKYVNKDKTQIPANIETKTSDRIRSLAKKIFKILNCHLYSRIDFFLSNNGEIILNEINTIPGFTNISMYPSLFKDYGIPLPELLEILITESLK